MELKSVTLWRRGRRIVIDVLVRPAKSGSGACHALILPGNPSVVPAYQEFSDRLADALHSVSVHTVGHAGFGFVDHHDGAVFDIEIKILYIERLLALSSPRIILIGHSVGAFMIMEIVKRRPDFPIDNAVFLFPSLCELEVAWPIHILKYPVVYEPLALLVSYLPDRFKILLASSIPQIQHEAEMIGGHFNAHTVRNTLALVRHELEVIRELPQASVDLLNEFGSRLLFVFTPFDQYVPLQLAERIRMRMPSTVHVIFGEDLQVQHAFVLKDSRQVASTVLEYLLQHSPSAKRDRTTFPAPA